MVKRIKPFLIIFFVVVQLMAFFACKITEPGEDRQKGTKLTREEQDLVTELNRLVYSIKPYPLFLPDNMLTFLDRLKNAKIIALGEATHGTSEFFQMKFRIFQYLVKYHRHIAFGFEADFGESIYLNNYITKGEGNLRELMKDKMHFWAWLTEEVYMLLYWMRSYNEGKNEAEMIHYYGFDCQYTTYQPALLQDYFSATLPELRDLSLPVLNQVENLTREDYESMLPETYESIKNQLEALAGEFTANKSQLILKSSLREYEINKQLLRTFWQAFIVRYHSYKKDSSINWRDQFMAENALWLAGLFGQDSKITLWAHNGHIARELVFGKGSCMGYHLYNELGDLYQAVGFAFSMGSFQAVGYDQNGNYTSLTSHEITGAPFKRSFNYIFHHVLYDAFVFNLDNVPAGSEVDRWLSIRRPFLMIGAAFTGNPGHYYRTINLRKHYNWIIYFDSTKAAIPLE